MGHKKPGSSSFSKLLTAEYVSTPLGNVCKKMEVVCIKCGTIFDVTVPDDAINEINDQSLVGTALIEYILKENGWVQTTVKRKNGKTSHYSVCPDCVENEFEILKAF